LKRPEAILSLLACMVLAVRRERQQPVIWGNASSDSAQVCLDLPDGVVDWTATAVAALGRARYAHPGNKVLRAALQPEAGRTAVVPFRAAAPAAVQARSWFVLYSGGSVAVHPTELHGNVVYFVNSKLALTQAPLASGTACAPLKIAQSAGFFASDVAIGDPHTVESAVTRVERDTFSISAGGHTIRFPRPGFVTAGALHVTLFGTAPGDTLALIEWDPGDGSTCGHMFTLITLVPSTRLPLDNGYDCDV